MPATLHPRLAWDVCHAYHLAYGISSSFGNYYAMDDANFSLTAIEASGTVGKGGYDVGTLSYSGSGIGKDRTWFYFHPMSYNGAMAFASTWGVTKKD